MTATLAFTAGTAFGIALMLVLWKRTERHGREWWVTGHQVWDSYLAAYNASERGEKPVHVREVTTETN